MSFKKHAAFKVISKVLIPQDATQTEMHGLMQRVSHRVEFDYEPQPGFLYVRSRAISSRCNDNYDEFPAEEIKKAYATFVGKPVFVNHHNDNHRRMRGVIIDAALHEDRNPDGTPDTWVEVLMEVDAMRFPVLAKAIVAGHIDRTSMGTDVAYSLCSACGNKASTPAEYCQHIPRMKGQRIYRAVGSNGKREGVLIREICHGLGFFENSLLVEEPADPTAFFLGVDERGMKMSSTAAKKKHLPKHETCYYGSHPATRRILHAEGMAYIPVCLFHEPQGIHDCGGQNGVSAIHDIPAAGDSGADSGGGDGGSTTAKRQAIAAVVKESMDSIPLSDDDRDFYRQMRDAGEMRQQMHDHAQRRVVNLNDSADLKSHMLEAHGWTEGDFWRNSHDEEHPGMGEMNDLDRPLTHNEVRAAHGHEHHVLYPSDYPHAVTFGDDHFHAAGPRTAAKEPLTFEAVLRSLSVDKNTTPVSKMNPEELAAHRANEAAASKWLTDHPVHHQNVIDHWNAATDEEKATGKSWYQDAHHLTKAVAHDTKTPMHTMAGLMSNYSPQTHWATNIMNAAKVARTKTGMGGPGSGMMASTRQKAAADRMLGGESYDTVLGGPKTHAFAHLIEHGGNKDANDPKVVVDRHALSVACGARASDMAYSRSGLSSKKKYQQAADAYHEAAKHISATEGEKVEAHQVQATTWLTRQRLNEEHDRALSKTAGSRSASIAKRAIGEWSKYAAEHHPSAFGKEPGTGYSKDAPEDVKHEIDMAQQRGSKVALRTQAYGEQKAPADVDTLRDDECPVCGESDSYDGNACQVCGFVAPPPMFQDPDLDLAKQLDLRKDIIDDANQLPGQVDNGGIPGEIPGETTPGSDATVDPDMLDEMGQVPVDEMGNPLIHPNQLGPDGQPIDPDAAARHFNQGGEAFTEGPDDPDEPGEPEGPGNEPDDEETVDPDQIGPDGQPVGSPGTPDDGVPDLQCPVCGFAADAVQPTSVDMDDQAMPDPDSADGRLAGDVCPNCGQGQMVSVGEAAQVAQQQQGVAVR